MSESTKTKDIICHKDTGGEGEMISCRYKRKASEVHLHPSSVILQQIKCKSFGQEGTSKCELKPLKEFKPGDMWSDDFNYCGMLEVGKKAKISDGVTKLNKIFDSYEDVNYHEESAPLFESIKLLEKKRKKQAEGKMNEFNKISMEVSKEIC